ncbi:MAG: DUF4861 family protein [Bacteroidota bacterium]
MRYLKYLYWSLFPLLAACGTSDDGPDEAAVVQELERPYQAQAFLLRQPHDYNPDSIKLLTGDYQPLTNYEVPANLKPHGFWLKFEGPTWESDRIGYRAYLDSRHRYDIFGKRTTGLVLDTVDLDYHKIHEWGSDILKVGSTLGMGSPAIYYQDSLYAWENYAAKRVEIVQSKGERAIFRYHIDGLRFADQEMDLMLQISIAAGEYQTRNRIEVRRSTLAEPVFAAGIVAHLPTRLDTMLLGQQIIANFGLQSYHDEKLGMAVWTSDKYALEVLQGTPLDSHVLTFRPSSGVAEYSFAAAWERGPDPVQTQAEFIKLLQAELTTPQ